MLSSRPLIGPPSPRYKCKKKVLCTIYTFFDHIKEYNFLVSQYLLFLARLLLSLGLLEDTALLLLILALIFSILTSGMDYDDCMLKPFTTHNKRQTAPDTNASPEKCWYISEYY